MKVAAAQMEVTDSTSENLQKMLQCIEKARKADVICFPELCLQSDEKNVLAIGKEITIIKNAAKKYSLAVIFGAYIKEKQKIKNKLFVINKEGELIHKYNKKNPYIDEKEYVTKGKVNKIFTLDGTPCAVINCWDYAFPEYLRTLARNGALVFFCPAYLLSHPLTHNVLRKIPQVRAFDTMSYFVMVDAFAPKTYQRSRICHPLKQLAFTKDKEDIIYAKLKIEEIRDLRQRIHNL